MATVSLQTVFDQARQAIETGAADKAVGIAQHILVHFPRMIEAHRLLGEAYLNVGEPAQAAAAFEQVLQADPENVAAYYGLGLAQQTVDQRPAAITAFERALEIQPNLADLRTQLMRLYAETPGSAGQFRLSRAGLGRLYARGGMTGQAIDEFRAVLDTDPDRDDVKVALAEALWRDGQEDEATDFCRDILDRRPDLHKPTLLLGYLLFAGGQPEGETLWRRAAEQDASLTVAHTLFDVLPPIRLEDPVLPEFNEAEWRAQVARRETEQQAPAPVRATADEEDFFADSWLSSTGSSTASNIARSYDTPALQPVVQNSATDDDFLASLLGLDSGAPEAPAPFADEPESVQPFALDDWGSEAGSSNETVLPASLNDFGLEDDRGTSDVEAVKPFSFDDWSFDEPGEGTPSQPAANTANDLDLSGVQGFSLEDTADAEESVQPFNFEASAPSLGVQPFSLDDDTADTGVQPFSFEDEATSASTVQPFSLDDDTSGDVQPFSFDDDDDLGLAPFSFENESQPAPQQNADAGLGAVQPFSLDDWGLEDDAVGSNTTASTSTGANAGDQDDLGGFQPFSLDDLSLDNLDAETESPLAGPQLSADLDDSEKGESFSWQEPSWRSQPSQDMLGNTDEGDSIFAKLMRNRPAASEDPSVAAPVTNTPNDQADDPSFFSFDNESLRFDDEPAGFESSYGANARSELPASAEDAGSTAANNGLADIAGFDMDDSFMQPAEGSVLAEETSSESQSTPAQVEDPNFAPFSLSELGLTDDEVAAFEASPTQPLEAAESVEAVQAPSQPQDEDTAPFSLSDLGFTDEDLAMLDAEAPQPDTGVEQPTDDTALPFSLADLGLSDDEIAALDLGETSPQNAPATDGIDDLSSFGATLALVGDASALSPASGITSEAGAADETPDMTPFSLADLGLSDDEISLLNQSDLPDEQPNVGGTETPITEAAGSFPEQSADDATAAQDVSQADEDVWANWEVESEADLGNVASAGDLSTDTSSIDLPNVQDQGAEVDETPDMTPFSLADLGLSDDEISLLGQDQAEQERSSEEQEQGVSDALTADVTMQPPTDARADDVPAFGSATDTTPSDYQLFENADNSVQDAVPSARTEAEVSATPSIVVPETVEPVATAAGREPSTPQADAPQFVNVGLQDVLAQLAADPQNDILRLAVARMNQQTNDVLQAVEHYKQLIKRGQLLDEVVDDLQDIIADTGDPQALRRLHRVLGDAFMKQNRFREAMDQYSWTLSRQ